MTVTIDVLEARRDALVRALDEQDADGIESAAQCFAAAVAGFAPAPADMPRLAAIAASLPAIQGRVNFLTDACRRRTENLAILRGAPAATYSSRAR